jgi:hypothetical protein
MDGRGYWRGAYRARIAALAAAAACSLCAATSHAQYPVPYTPPATSQPSQAEPPPGQYGAPSQGQPAQGQYGAQPQGQPQGQYAAPQGQYAAQPQGQYAPPPNQDSGPSRQAFTAERISVEGGVRFGSRNLNFGVGGRVGYTLNFNLYFGGLFDYWFGKSEEQTVPGAGTISASAHGWDLMGEAGYDFGIVPTVVIRPFGGFGVFHADVESCAPAPIGCISGSDSTAAGEFGGAVIVSLEGLHLGAEFRVMFAEETVIVIGANIGGDF